MGQGLETLTMEFIKKKAMNRINKNIRVRISGVYGAARDLFGTGSELYNKTSV